MKLLVKGLLIALIPVLFVMEPVIAATKYVTETFEITMRTGPGVDRKIISLIQSGRALDVLTSGEEWSQVKTPGGKEGWVLSRYLTDDTPSAMLLERLKINYDRLLSKNAELKEQNKTLLAKRSNLESVLSQSQKSNQKLDSDYEKLKKESADFLKLKTTYTKTAKALDQEKEKAGQLDSQVSTLSRNRNIKWFLSGAGAVLVGFILGLISRKRRRRSSLL